MRDERDQSTMSIEDREVAIYPALGKIANYMEWSTAEVIWWWEGGEHDQDKWDRLHKEMADKGFNCDSDDTQCYSQWFHEENILNAEECYVLGLPKPLTKQFFCVWGDGYVGVNEDATTETHDLEYFTEGMGFEKEHIQRVSDLFLGGSVQIMGCTEVMSVVRIR